MHDYLKKFLLNELSVFVVGGSGLIGSEICNAVTCAGANTIVLDKIKITNKKINNSTSLIWRKFDCSNLNNLEKQFLNILNHLSL